MEENKVASDKELKAIAERAATTIGTSCVGECHERAQGGFHNKELFDDAVDAIFRELVAVRDRAIEQCGADCQYDKGYEDGCTASTSGVYHIEHLDIETVRLTRKGSK